MFSWFSIYCGIHKTEYKMRNLSIKKKSLRSILRNLSSLFMIRIYFVKSITSETRLRLFFSAADTDMPHHNAYCCHHHAGKGHRHGHRVSDNRKQKLICPKGFDPESSDSIAQKIEKEHFSVKGLVLRICDQQE